MTDILELIETDRQATLAMNGSDSLFMDGVMSMFSSMSIWILVAIVTIFLILRNNSRKQIILVLLMLALTVICCDQLASLICKPLIARFRPSQEPFILNLVDTVNGYRGGQYGFFSSHAANSFGVVVFLMWLVKDVRFGSAITVWAIINSYSRIYLGVHYLGDVLTGVLTGIMFGSLFYWVLRFFIRKERVSGFSEELYTTSGYLLKDISLFCCTLYATYLFIVLDVCILQGMLPY